MRAFLEPICPLFVISPAERGRELDSSAHLMLIFQFDICVRAATLMPPQLYLCQGQSWVRYLLGIISAADFTLSSVWDVPIHVLIRRDNWLNAQALHSCLFPLSRGVLNKSWSHLRHWNQLLSLISPMSGSQSRSLKQETSQFRLW